MDNSANSSSEQGKIADSIYSIYRVSNNGEPSIILQSDGCCMVDENGKLTRETQLTMQSEMGEQAARSLAKNAGFHIHVKMPPAVQSSSKIATENEKK